MNLKLCSEMFDAMDVSFIKIGQFEQPNNESFKNLFTVNYGDLVRCEALGFADYATI